jgi:hypothetical protein
VERNQTVKPGIGDIDLGIDPISPRRKASAFVMLGSPVVLHRP